MHKEFVYSNFTAFDFHTNDQTPDALKGGTVGTWNVFWSDDSSEAIAMTPSFMALTRWVSH